MRATRADVAKLANVSTATVSNVLNNVQKVKRETVERVMQAVEQLNYRPDMIARSLITGQTRQIGIVLENIRNPHYGEIVEHFEAAAEARGYFVNICTSIAKLDNYFDNFIDRGLDGAFVAALPYKFDIEKLYNLIQYDIKVVVSGNINADLHRVSFVENDYVKGMRKAITYLVSLGHKDIAYLSGLGRELTYDERCKGYIQCVQEMQLPCGESLLFDGKYPFFTNTREGYQLAKRLLDSRKPFTAAICGNDLMAIGAIKAFHDNGLSVPEDVSVIGFDGIELGRYCRPPLTTLAVDGRVFGKTAFELLYNNMNKGLTGFCLNELVFSEGQSTAAKKST
jgi:DNA-binding LacI/PurR family transcriptional regulator